MHLYLHIPFCRRACHYCDFHFSTSLAMKSSVVEGIIKEIYLQQDYLKSKELHTIYFGGGTPSLLNINELYDIFKAIHDCFQVRPDAEITLEINPDDVSKERIAIWQRFGINRLSMGIQSFQDDYLAYLNRIHNADMARRAVWWAQEADLTNLTIDLIYGINPMHTKTPKRRGKFERLNYLEPELHAKWADDLAIALELGVPHISAYCLTIEERTVFGMWQKNKHIPPQDEHFAAKQFSLLQNELGQHGFEQYEISNFARPGYYAKHNTSYWQGEEYLGVGPSAHSYNGISRQHNIANNTLYIKALEKNELAFEREELSVFDRQNELIMTGLRTQWGVHMPTLKALGPLPEAFYQELARQEAAGAVIRDADTLRLAPQARFLADGIAAALFLT